MQRVSSMKRRGVDGHNLHTDQQLGADSTGRALSAVALIAEAISTFAKSGDWQNAVYFLQEMHRYEVQSDVVAWQRIRAL